MLLMHLGMSGAFRVLRPRRVRAVRVRSAADDRLLPHDHLVLELSGGRVVVFNDPRRFGFVTLLGSGERETHAALRALGPEPLARGFGAPVLARAGGAEDVPESRAVGSARQ